MLHRVTLCERPIDRQLALAAFLTRSGTPALYVARHCPFVAITVIVTSCQSEVRLQPLTNCGPLIFVAIGEFEFPFPLSSSLMPFGRLTSPFAFSCRPCCVFSDDSPRMILRSVLRLGRALRRR